MLACKKLSILDEFSGISDLERAQLCGKQLIVEKGPVLVLQDLTGLQVTDLQCTRVFQY